VNWLSCSCLRIQGCLGTWFWGSLCLWCLCPFLMCILWLPLCCCCVLFIRRLRLPEPGGLIFPCSLWLLKERLSRFREMNGFATAPVTFALGIVFSLLVFPAPIAYAAIAVLTLGDGFACVFGVIFGKTPKRFKNCFKTVSLLFQPTYL
jgi:dolichol kinase